MFIVLKEETSIRFAWEDWNEKYSKSRKRTSYLRRDPSKSTARTPKLSSAARNVARLTPSEQRLLGQENLGRSTGHCARPVQMSARQLNSCTPKVAATSKSANSRRPPLKSVRSRGTQLDSTPIPVGAGVSSSRTLLTPNVQNKLSILRRLEETPLESTSLAWNRFRSPSTVGQTPNPRELDAPVAESSGNIADMH